MQPVASDIGMTGPLSPELGGYGPATFAGSDGRFVAGLLRRLAVPGASRWAHIVLRRALLSRSAGPAGITPGDWTAVRARALLAMGEVDGAKLLVDELPADHFTPEFVRAAGQVHLAAADLPGLCPIADTGGAISADPLWKLAEAMCALLTAGLQSDTTVSGPTGPDTRVAGLEPQSGTPITPHAAVTLRLRKMREHLEPPAE